jgi:hypothetical protein
MTVVVESHWLANQIKIACGEEKEVVVIPNGVDVDLFKPSLKKRRVIF